MFCAILSILVNKYSDQYLQHKVNVIFLPARGDETIYEFNDIRQIDIFMQTFNS